MTPRGEAALQLSWLAPCAESLLALAQTPGTTAWQQVRADPGAVLLLVRYALPAASACAWSLFSPLTGAPAVLEAAHAHLQAAPPTFVSWDQEEVAPIYQASLLGAQLAERLAEATGSCDRDHAWVAALLAPLGWLAACAGDASQAAAAWREWRRQGHLPPGFDPVAWGRRLARRWRLPAWLLASSAYLGVPLEVAQQLGADPHLFQVVQTAIALLEEQGAGLGLPCGRTVADGLSALGLNPAEAQTHYRDSLAAVQETVRRQSWRNPYTLELLPEVLRLAAASRRSADLPLLEQLQEEVDVLARALQLQVSGEEARLQTRKLSALAELAAGASHEINNPLAVISGQAQYLLRRLGDEPLFRSEDSEFARRWRELVQHSLHTIIGQTQRIHQLLTDLLWFARPPAPHKQLIDIEALLQETVADLQSLAQERQVQLRWQGPEVAVTLYGDPGHLRRALSALVRNALEAAPAQGWVSVRAWVPRPDCLEFLVEDNGRGPPPEDREHLFDPFYSGRQAGRGRGLGLPTAWRLAREHGGEVLFAPTPEGVTRFILRLPLLAEKNSAPPAGHNTCFALPPASVA
jgi:two-component system NtrC family sensor kinase